jgi:hypothetical protein
LESRSLLSLGGSTFQLLGFILRDKYENVEEKRGNVKEKERRWNNENNMGSMAVGYNKCKI